jgi:mono/diheme cytochrome c family protein
MMHPRPSALVVLAGAFAIAVTGAFASTGSPLANGKAIFQTGRDLAGKPIGAVPRPMMPTCAGCHRANGSGGVHLPGGAVSADLRHAALIKLRPPYTPALLERAISTGIDSQGQKLSPVMPRWRLSKTDLHDVAQYVWTQLK